MRIAIPLFDGFTALDAVGPFEVLSRLPGAEVVFVAEAPGPYRTDSGGLQLVAEHSFTHVQSADVLMVPGGPGTRAFEKNRSLVEWIRVIHPTTQWTSSVCTGALFLGAAGILKGLRATTHWLELERLGEFGATPVSERVVFEGKVVTAAGVSAGIDMGLALAGRIAGESVARTIQLSIEYDPQPPFDSGSVEKAGPELVRAVRARAAQRFEAARKKGL